jgi:glycerophosphoryl diester phosphodiesterase
MNIAHPASTAPPRSSHVERIGHRGAPKEFRENTLGSFERALELGADAVELDVHATADGIVVVHHDATLEHTCVDRVRSLPLASFSWEELQGIEIEPGTTVPSLAQVLDLIGTRATAYVEIKGAGIESLVVETIRRSPTRCAVHSFDHACIARASEIAPELPRGILLDRTSDNLDAAMRETRARDVWPNWRLIDERLVDAVHSRHGRVIAWTVNSADEAVRLARLGVDGICTDLLPLITAVAHERGA